MAWDSAYIYIDLVHLTGVLSATESIRQHWRSAQPLHVCIEIKLCSQPCGHFRGGSSASLRHDGFCDERSVFGNTSSERPPCHGDLAELKVYIRDRYGTSLRLKWDELRETTVGHIDCLIVVCQESRVAKAAAWGEARRHACTKPDRLRKQTESNQQQLLQPQPRLSKPQQQHEADQMQRNRGSSGLPRIQLQGITRRVSEVTLYASRSQSPVFVQLFSLLMSGLLSTSLGLHHRRSALVQVNWVLANAKMNHLVL